MMEDYDSTLSYYQTLIENRLSELVQKREPNNLYSPIEYILLDGGKRIRPLLCMLACEATGGDPFESVDAAVAVEIMHNFTLVHDDIMDNSPLRRGKTTIHLKWDLPTAILSGDAMVGLALEVLATYSNYTNFGKIIEQFAYGYIEVCEGQALDMLFNNRKDVTTDDYFHMVRKKTSAVIQTSLVLGGLCAGAIEDDLENLKEFGLNLGIAFQLQDDYLDLKATDMKLGKRIGNDILEKKKTLMVLMAFERAKLEKDKSLLERLYSPGEIPKELIPEFVELFERLDVFNDVQETINSYFEKASNALDNLSRNQGTKMLKYLLDKINVRSY